MVLEDSPEDLRRKYRTVPSSLSLIQVILFATSIDWSSEVNQNYNMTIGLVVKVRPLPAIGPLVANRKAHKLACSLIICSLDLRT